MPEPRDQHDDKPDSRRASIRQDQRKRQPRRQRQESPQRYDESGEAGNDADAETVESDMDRRRRRAVFLRELNEAKALRERVQPRRARAARMRQAMRMRTFRW
ncbi:hypothetical protein [Streptomyces macrosporus]|uniref:Uncharacterized protein n=1 Tax=Streptomyces macrosporus TaxID=44032 RepID=A0ABN3JIF2_9ACTN